jgi:uncharacterized protein YvpB
MKKNALLGTFALAAIALTSCQKDAGVNAPSNPEFARNSGVIADDPAAIAKVPMIVSSDFMRNGSFTQFVALNSPNGNTAAKGPRGGGSTSTKDITPPSVAFTAPTNGSSVSGTVNISIGASDNMAVSSVTFSVNGVLTKSWSVAPYSTSWAVPADGSYTLTATAKDAAGNSATNSIVVSKSTTIIVTPPPTNLPTSFMLATPPVMYQGGEGSCLSMALTVQRNIEQYYTSGSTSYTTATNQLSPEFLYNYTKFNSGCGSGAAILSSLSFMTQKGICTWNSLPYSSLNGCDTSIISSSMKNEALNYRIPTFRMISTSDLVAIKTAIASKHPATITFQMDSNFYNAYPGYIWNSRGTLMSTHAVTIVGYDDNLKAFKVQNSWGTTWGDQGFTWVDYNFLATITGGVYVMY